MKKIISLITATALLVLSLFSLTSCFGMFEKFTVYSCGSGFYFGGKEDKVYTIKELGVESTGNWFYLDDYFYSTELGDAYTVKSGLFSKETVYLAKKADHYNSQVFEFNLDTYDQRMITITPEMSYVRIYSSDPQKTYQTYIEVEERSMPVDITFENVNIRTAVRLPVLFSQSLSDINIIVKGTNTFASGRHNYSEESFKQYLEGKASDAEQAFYSSVGELYNRVTGFGDGANENGLANHLTNELISVGKSATTLFEGFMEGSMGILSGEEGAKGIDGVATIMHFGGVSISGDGSLTITGGDGADGSDANDSLAGLADGGNGGMGGAGIHCGYLFANSTVSLEVNGGAGGMGGEPSKGMFGLFGSSGNKGRTGMNGRSYDVVSSKIVN